MEIADAAQEQEQVVTDGLVQQKPWISVKLNAPPTLGVKRLRMERAELVASFT